MDVMFTTHPKDGAGKYYMVVAEAGEWAEVLGDIYAGPITDATRKLIRELESWGVEL